MEGVLHAQLAVATRVAQSGGQARVEVAVQVFVSPTEKIDGELLQAAIVPAATRVLDAHVLRLVALPAAAASQAFAAGAAGLFTIGRLAAQGCEGGSNPAARAQPKRVLGVASRGLRFSMWGIRDADSACQPFSHVLGDDRTAVFELLRASGTVARMAASVASAASGGGASTAPASASDGPLAVLLTRERAALTDPERGQLLVNHYWDCKGLAVWRVTSRDDAAALQKRVVAGCLAAAPYSSGAVRRGGGGAAVVGVLVEHPSAVPIGGALGNGGSGAPADGGGDGDSGEVASGGHAEDAAAAPTTAAVKRGRGRPSKAASAASAAVAAAAAAVAEEEEEAAATASSSSVRGALNRAARNSGRNSRRPAPYREPPPPPPPSASAGVETAASSAPGISAAAGGGGGKSLPVPSAVGGGGAVAGGGGGGDGIWGPLSSAVDGTAGGDGFDDHGLDVLSGRVGGSGAGAGARGRRSSDRGGGRSSSGSAGSITTSTAAASLATPYFAVSIGINTPISSSDDDGNGEACSASSDDDVELLEVMPIDGVSPVCLATAVESISRSGVSAPSLASVSSTVPQPVTLTASHRPPSVPAPLAGNTRAAAPLLSTASTVALQSAPPPLWRGGEVIRAPKQVGTSVAVPSGICSDSGLPPLHQPLSGPRVPPATLRASTTTTAAVTFASSVRPDEAALSTSGVLSSAGGRSGGGGSGGADNTNITAVSAHISAAVPSGGATMSLPVSMGASGRAPEAIATLRSTAAPVPAPLPSGKQPTATAFSAQPALLLQRAGRGSGAAVRKQQPGLGAALPLVSCLPSSISPPGPLGTTTPTAPLLSVAVGSPRSIILGIGGGDWGGDGSGSAGSSQRHAHPSAAVRTVEPPAALLGSSNPSPVGAGVQPAPSHSTYILGRSSSGIVGGGSAGGEADSSCAGTASFLVAEHSAVCPASSLLAAVGSSPSSTVATSSSALVIPVASQSSLSLISGGGSTTGRRVDSLQAAPLLQQPLSVEPAPPSNVLAGSISSHFSRGATESLISVGCDAGPTATATSVRLVEKPLGVRGLGSIQRGGAPLHLRPVAQIPSSSSYTPPSILSSIASSSSASSSSPALTVMAVPSPGARACLEKSTVDIRPAFATSHLGEAALAVKRGFASRARGSSGGDDDDGEDNDADHDVAYSGVGDSSRFAVDDVGASRSRSRRVRSRYSAVSLNGVGRGLPEPHGLLDDLGVAGFGFASVSGGRTSGAAACGSPLEAAGRDSGGDNVLVGPSISITLASVDTGATVSPQLVQSAIGEQLLSYEGLSPILVEEGGDGAGSVGAVGEARPLLYCYMLGTRVELISSWAVPPPPLLLLLPLPPPTPFPSPPPHPFASIRPVRSLVTCTL